MRGHHDLLRRLQQEPGREFSTGDLVETLYPEHWKAIRKQLALGDKLQQRHAQAEKTRLHRKALYYIGQLVTQGILVVVRLDSHGEKRYQVALPHATVQTVAGPMVLQRTELSLPMLVEDLASRQCAIFEPHTILGRFEACYLHGAAVEGLGQLLQYAEYGLRATSDTLAIGGLSHILQRYRTDDIQEFVHALSMQTLDEGRAVVFLLDANQAGDRALALVITELQPARVQFILASSSASLRDSAVHTLLEACRTRLGKLTVSVRQLSEPPVFVGRAGPYEVPAPAWEAVQRGETPIVVVSRASVTLDLGRIKQALASDVVSVIRRATKAAFSIAAQQRIAGTGVLALGNISPSPVQATQHAAVTIRIWNYDWETPPTFLPLLRPTCEENIALHAHAYRACGMPLHCEVACTTAFAKYDSGLSSRSYRKWTVSSEQDLHTPNFAAYRDARATVTHQLGGLDRLRIFRTGSPSGAQVAAELAWLAAAGFPLVTYEFKAIGGVRTLGEYFGGTS